MEKYTTCDQHDHPHFYLNLTEAKMKQGKYIVTGPAYLVVEDVPLPLVLSFGLFPFPRIIPSGIPFPFGDELSSWVLCEKTVGIILLSMIIF